MAVTLKLGLIGAGRIARVHSRNIATRFRNVEIAMVADPLVSNPIESRKIEAWAVEDSISRISADYREVLSDPSIKAVLICSSTDTHALICQEAAEAGKHIFCEKPLDKQSRVIRQTLRVIEKSHVHFQIGFNRRFDHNFLALRRANSESKIGIPHILRITSRDPSPPPVEYVRVSGGLFLDMAIHDFDMARYLMASEVVQVHAAGAVLVDSAIGKEGDIDTALTTLWFANGALGVIDNSRKAAYGYDQRAEIFGSLGSAETFNDKSSMVRISDEAGCKDEKPLYFFLERYAESFADEIKYFLDAVGSGVISDAPEDKSILPGAEAALKSVLIAEAARQSLLTGRPVKVEEA